MQEIQALVQKGGHAGTATSSTPKINYSIGELFCGAGGLALGASLAKFKGCGFHHLWANDMDKHSCETFRHNLPIKADNVICRRVEELDFTKLSKIDGLTFGFPCNDFSLVGKQRGITGKYGGLYKWGARA